MNNVDFFQGVALILLGYFGFVLVQYFKSHNPTQLILVMRDKEKRKRGLTSSPGTYMKEYYGEFRK